MNRALRDHDRPRHRSATRTLFGLALACLALAPFPLHAQRTCSIFVSGMAFGTYTPGTPAPLDSRSWILVRCIGNRAPSQPSFYTIRINGGASSDPANRYMQSVGGQLNYNLYQNAARTTIWGDGTSGTTPVFGGMGMGLGFGNRRWYFHRVYGRSFGGQDPPPGAYSDGPIVTIEF